MGRCQVVLQICAILLNIIIKYSMFLTIKKKAIIISFCLIFCVASVIVYFAAIKPTFMPKAEHVIVIDAGHGGKDGGAVGDSVTESELNLKFSQALKKICQSFGYGVVMTRSDMSGLYSPTASNKKKSEMEKRKQIIDDSGADMVVSIHMNSFPSSDARGAQVYYADGSLEGQVLAESVQKTLHEQIGYAKATAKVGDFYILNCTQKPSILVECGFLSNPDEERLLLDEEYMNKFCYNLFCGILRFYSYN